MLGFVDMGAKKNKWSVATDSIYMNLGKKITREGAVLPGDINVKLDMRSFINTTNVGYQIGGDDTSPISLIGGVRYLYLRTSAEFDKDNLGDRRIIASGHNWSGIFGFEGKKTLNDKWYLDYYADIGAGGQTDLTWQAKIGGGYHFKKFVGTFGCSLPALEFRRIWQFRKLADHRPLRRRQVDLVIFQEFRLLKTRSFEIGFFCAHEGF